MKKKIIISIIVLIVIASISVNIYFGWKKMEANIYSAGIQDTVSSIINQVNSTGQVIINLPDKQMILIPR